MVRVRGLEPPRVSSQEPKPCASTSSATPAQRTKHKLSYTKYATIKQAIIYLFCEKLKKYCSFVFFPI